LYFLVSISLHHIIIDSFIDYRAFYKGVLNPYSCNLDSLWTMIGFMYNLKVHNKLNTKGFSTNILQIYVLMYEIIIDMSPFLSLTKYKLEFTSLTI